VKNVFIFLIGVFISLQWHSLLAADSGLVPFLLDSTNPLDYNQKVLAQRNLIRGRRVADQQRKFKGKFVNWFSERPHAYYQRVLMEDAPIVATQVELPSELVFYDLFPELRKVARIDHENRRYNDRMRFIDYDRHQTIFGETIFEETTGRYLDP
tara:strand:+ start:542 stop:1003 length:462 start_codon:yes stop_codon:yes gene_type:complete